LAYSIAQSIEQGVKLQRVLTDRGTEYCGNPERHEYEPEKFWPAHTAVTK